jgi:hypothetical protein
MKILRVLKSRSAVVNRLFTSAILIFLFIGVSEATIYYVDNTTTGCTFSNHIASNYNPATKSCGSGSYSVFDHPYYAGVYSSLQPGDTVIVKNGTYGQNNDCKGEVSGDCVMRITHGGTSSNWLTFKAENTWGAKLDGQNKVNFCVLFDSTNNPAYIRFEGFDVYNCCYTTGNGDAIFINARDQNDCNDSHTHDIYLYKNKIHDVCRIQSNRDYGQAGVDMDQCTGPITIDSNVFYNIGRLNPYTAPSAPESSCTIPYGQPLSPPNPGTCTNTSGCVLCYNHDPAIYNRTGNVTVINNIFYPDIVSGWAMQPYAIFGPIPNMKIVNNTFYGSNPQRDYHILLAGWDGYDNILIQNNIFHSPRNYALNTQSVATNVTVRNNLVYGASLIYGTGCSDPDYTCSGNITGQDPKFVDYKSYNFHLQSVSPAINKGLSFSGRTKDADGNSIVGAPDIGAYEYAISDTTPPASPAIMEVK